MEASGVSLGTGLLQVIEGKKTDHKMLVGMLNKDVITISYTWHNVMLLALNVIRLTVYDYALLTVYVQVCI